MKKTKADKAWEAWKAVCQKAQATYDAKWIKRAIGVSAHREYNWQVYGSDADGGLVFAGVYNARKATAKTALKIARKHRHWRFEYDHLPENLSRDYPAKHDKPVREIALYPIGKPEQILAFSVV